MATRRDILQQITTPIAPLYGAHEARQIALIVLSEQTGCSISQLLADLDQEQVVGGLDRLIKELSAGRPLQYVLGSTEFCGVRIGVREGVLIPRPETELLVQWIVEENPGAHHLLDIGTGSGCIALALKSMLPKANVTGIDISETALTIAGENAAALGLPVAFRRANALDNLAQALPQTFDVIVSNPPYIPASDRTNMRSNVTEHEPEGALFVPDDDPLCFYRAIARAAGKMLCRGGKLYYEIHELFGSEVRTLLRDEGFTHITLRNDFLEKPRMVCCWNDR